jgi:hypothetical protein
MLRSIESSALCAYLQRCVSEIVVTLINSSTYDHRSVEKLGIPSVLKCVRTLHSLTIYGFSSKMRNLGSQSSKSGLRRPPWVLLTSILDDTYSCFS